MNNQLYEKIGQLKPTGVQFVPQLKREKQDERNSESQPWIKLSATGIRSSPLHRRGCVNLIPGIGWWSAQTADTLALGVMLLGKLQAYKKEEMSKLLCEKGTITTPGFGDR